MKTIPVSLLAAGILLPTLCLAQPPPRPDGPPRDGKRPPPPFMKAWKRADADGNGLISRAEFDAMPRIDSLPEEKRAAIFTRLDKDGDGNLGRDELARFAKPREGRPMKPLWELDADKSGGVSFDEFKAGNLFKKLPPERMEKVFQRLDTDGDGFITPKDRPEPPFKRKGRRHPGDDDGRGPFNPKLDANGDGALSFDEFRASPAVRDLSEDEQEDRFEALDRNHDHKLSVEDIPRPPVAEKP